MPDASVNFKCIYGAECHFWFSFQEAKKETIEGKCVKIYCPKCNTYVQKIPHKVSGRSGMNVEKNGLSESTIDPRLDLRYLLGHFKGKEPPPWPGADSRIDNRNLKGVEGPFLGNGDTSPKMNRYYGGRDFNSVFRKATKRVPKKKNISRF